MDLSNPAQFGEFIGAVIKAGGPIAGAVVLVWFAWLYGKRQHNGGPADPVEGLARAVTGLQDATKRIEHRQDETHRALDRIEVRQNDADDATHEHREHILQRLTAVEVAVKLKTERGR